MPFGLSFIADQTELDQPAVDLFDLRRRQAERLLLHASRGPHDRPPSLLPILRLREAEQPVDRVHQARRDTELWCRFLEGREQLPGTVTPSGRPAKPSAVRSVFSSPGVIRRKPVGGRAKPPCGAPWAQFSCAIVILLLG